MNNSIIYISIFFFFFIKNIAAQSSINQTGAAPDASAMLDIESTTKGMLIPRMTSTQRNLISDSAEGLMVYDKTTASFWFYDGTAWDELIDTNQPAASSISDNDNNTKIQTEESTDEDKIRFDINGQEALVLRTNNNGNAILELQNTNTCIGQNSGAATSTGINNTFFGALSGNANTTGSNNVFLGQNTGMANLSGGLNVYIGYQSGKTQTSGSRNVYVGASSGQGRTGGSQNVIIGQNSGNTSDNGSGNVFIGSGDAGNTITGSNQLSIAIGGTALINGDFSTNTLSFQKNIYITNGLRTNNHWITNDGDDEGIYINSSGQVGINTSNPTVALDINGDFKTILSSSYVNFGTNDYQPLFFTNPTKMINIQVNSNGTLNTGYTSSAWVSTTKAGTGTYNISFLSNHFSKVPIVTGMSLSVNKVVIKSVSATSLVIETRKMNGDLVDSAFSLNIIGE